MRVSEDDTDLGGRETLSSKLEDVVADLLRGGLEPRGGGSLVRQSRGGDTLSGSVHSSSHKQRRQQKREGKNITEQVVVTISVRGVGGS